MSAPPLTAAERAGIATHLIAAAHHLDRVADMIDAHVPRTDGCAATLLVMSAERYRIAADALRGQAVQTSCSR